MPTRVESPLSCLLVVAALAFTAACQAPDEAARDIAPEAARREAEAWRAKHEADYRREWVTIAGLHFLKDGAQTVGSSASSDIVLPASAPPIVGRLVLDSTTVHFEPAPGAPVTLRDQPVTGPLVLRDDGGPETDEVTAGGVRFVVHKSGDRLSLRVWDPEGPQARGFLGFTWFEIQPAYRVVARFIRDASPKSLQVLNTFGDVDAYTTEGVVEFQLQGQTLRLRPFTTRPTRFYFVFKDASSGSETYAAARFLYSDLRDDGTTVLDFNQAYNPPCAFNPFTTCPLPLAENRLPIKVLAGERAYPVHVELPRS